MPNIPDSVWEPPKSTFKMIEGTLEKIGCNSNSDDDMEWFDISIDRRYYYGFKVFCGYLNQWKQRFLELFGNDIFDKEINFKIEALIEYNDRYSPCVRDIIYNYKSLLGLSVNLNEKNKLNRFIDL